MSFEVKDYNTGEVFTHRTLQALSKRFEMHHRSLRSYVDVPLLYHNRWLMRTYNPEVVTWPERQSLLVKRVYNKGVEIRFIKDLSIHYFRTIREGAAFIRAHPDTLRRWLNEADYTIKFKEFQVKYSTDVVHWDAISTDDDMYVRSNRRCKIICVVNGTPLIYASKEDAILSQCIARNTIDSYLNTGRVDRKGRLWMSE